MGDTITLLIVLGLVGLAIFLYFKFFKLYKVKNIVFIDGSLGTGKTFLSVCLAVRLYKRQRRRARIKRGILSFLGLFSPKMKEKAKLIEDPILYSNILLRNIPFCKVTKDLLMRQKYRFAYGSVLLIDEASLVADQMCYKDREISKRLSIFFKLWRHETRGGYIVINSQSTSDLHYSVKYVLSDYLYIHHTSKFPFVWCMKVQEMSYCGDQAGMQVVNVRQGDIEDNNKIMLVLSKYKKYYDSVAYSIFTDGLEVYRKIEERGKDDSLKDMVLVSFMDIKYLTENLEEQNNEA